jgi:dephospho-CoA kinase
VIAGVAAEPLRIARLMAARGWSEDEARRRLGVQRPDAEFEAAADVTLDNRGSREELEQAAGAALERLRSEHAARLAAEGDGC